MRGCFITFEGGEGAGKSTQIERLRRRLEGFGHAILVTREPGGSPKAEAIRKLVLAGQIKERGPFAEALLFSAARIDHLDQRIRPALEQGIHVLCDRFADSTRAYQGARGGVSLERLKDLERVVVGDTAPDLTIILDLPPAAGLARARQRREAKGEGTDRFEAEDAAFHEILREAFLAIAREEPRRCVVVDAAGDPDAVEEAVWSAVRDRLPALASRPGAKPGEATPPGSDVEGATPHVA
jgi:dTMP kinase